MDLETHLELSETDHELAVLCLSCVASGLQDPPMVLPMYHIGMHEVTPYTPVHKLHSGELAKKLPNVGEDTALLLLLLLLLS